MLCSACSICLGIFRCYPQRAGRLTERCPNAVASPVGVKGPWLNGICHSYNLVKTPILFFTWSIWFSAVGVTLVSFFHCNQIIQDQCLYAKISVKLNFVNNYVVLSLNHKLEHVPRILPAWSFKIAVIVYPSYVCMSFANENNIAFKISLSVGLILLYIDTPLLEIKSLRQMKDLQQVETKGFSFSTWESNPPPEPRSILQRQSSMGK